MKENKTGQIQCRNIETWIAKKFSSELSEEETLLLSEHLLDCQSCYSAMDLAESMFQALHHSHETSINPDPAMRQMLRKRVKRVKQTEKIAPQMPFAFMIHLLKIRVPVYQAVLGMILCLGILLYANYLSFPDSHSLSGAAESVQYADSTGLIDTIKTSVPDKVGRSLREDSLLTKFFRTVM